MSDSEDQFKPKEKYLSKEEHIYGIFTEAYSKPSFGRGQKKSQPIPGQTNRSISFKSGQKIQTYSDKIQITLCQTSTKKKNNNAQVSNNIYNKQPIQIVQEPQGQQIFTLDSLMNVLSYNQKKNEIQQIQEKVIEKGFTSNTKEILKLRKFQKQIMTQYDYALPTEFGKKPQGIKTIKSNQQIEKEQQFAQRYGIGYKILSKIGFDVTKGLGKNQDGILAPVQSISKQAFIAQDYQEIIGNQQNEEEEMVQEVETKDKKILELFQYFSQDPSINSILSQLKTKYQSLESALSQQIQQIQELKGQFQIEQSHAIQRQSEHKQQQNKRNQLVQLSSNNSSHPHLALKFGIDLLTVQDSIKKIKMRKFQSIIDYEFAFNEIKETGRKLQQIYLEKQRENIRQFTSIGLKKSNGLNRLEDTISVSEEDVKKIAQLKKQVFQQTMQPYFQKLLNQLIVTSDKQSQICIQVLRGLGKIDKTIQQKYLDTYVYPILNKYLITFDFTKKLPHLTLFPWFPILSINKLNFKAFIQHLLSFDWTPETNTMFQIVSPWKKYIDPNSWNKLINFGIVPKLLLFLQNFQIKVTNQNSDNINKLRAFIKYSALLTSHQIQFILQDAILPMIKYIYQQLKGNQPEDKTSAWLNSWKSTIKKIITSDTITTFFGDLAKQN